MSTPASESPKPAESSKPATTLSSAPDTASPKTAENKPGPAAKKPEEDKDKDDKKSFYENYMALYRDTFAIGKSLVNMTKIFAKENFDIDMDKWGDGLKQKLADGLKSLFGKGPEAFDKGAESLAQSGEKEARQEASDTRLSALPDAASPPSSTVAPTPTADISEPEGPASDLSSDNEAGEGVATPRLGSTGSE